MKIIIPQLLAVIAAIATPTQSFSLSSNAVVRPTSSTTLYSTMADSGKPPSSAEATSVEDALIPTNLPSDVGMDYVPLATMLASGQLAEADQVSQHYLSKKKTDNYSTMG
jgi:hypothetical protein